MQANKLQCSAYLEFERIRDLNSHDDTSLARMETARRRLGSVALACSSFGEATHKGIKAAFQKSNKKSAGLERQTPQ
ncbi:g5398 [Coccomyxa elongata]